MLVGFENSMLPLLCVVDHVPLQLTMLPLRTVLFVLFHIHQFSVQPLRAKRQIAKRDRMQVAGCGFLTCIHV